MHKKITIISLLFLTVNSFAVTPFNEPPEWAKTRIWYQLFVERFYNGDKTNDPTPQTMDVPDMKIITPKNWKISSWTGDWFEKDGWMKNSDKSFNELLQYRRYGGDLQGVLDKLDYLQNLGINAIYLNPINDAPSLHKYDARNYRHVDVNFGPDPEGDIKIMQSENPADPATWQWTAADKMFLKLISECHKRGIKLILDYSWNHTGTLFWAWQDILKNQSLSKFKNWYNITSFDNPETPANEFKYEGWYSNAYMPELKKTDIQGERISGKPYEGNMEEAVKQHIFNVSKRWLAPDGHTENGVDGFRLDVADQIGLGFWRDYRKFVRSVKDDAYLIGEIWWEKWPDKLMNPTPYLQGDIFDAVMYYQVYKPARSFFAKTNQPIKAQQLVDSLQSQWNQLRPENLLAEMNVSSTHDTPRLLSDFFNTNPYKFHANPNENPLYKTGKPDKETYQRLKLYLVHLFTTIGAPQIWNGEEMGMWGADDPYNRKPLWWSDMKFKPENRNNISSKAPQYDQVGFNNDMFLFYQKLIKIRKENQVLNNGSLHFTIAKGQLLAYERMAGNDLIIVLFNNSDQTQKLPFQTGKYINLLTGKEINGNEISLRPITAAILKKL